MATDVRKSIVEVCLVSDWLALPTTPKMLSINFL